MEIEYEKNLRINGVKCKQWHDGDFETHPLRSWATIKQTALEVWKHLKLDDPMINRKINGEPIFYLNEHDPNKLLEVAHNTTVRDVAVALEGQITQAVEKRNVDFKAYPKTDFKYKIQLESAIVHIEYMFFEVYFREGCPKKNRSNGRLPRFYRNDKDELQDWPIGLTYELKAREEKIEAKKDERAKVKREKEKEEKDWVDAGGTRKGFDLCRMEDMREIVEEITFKLKKYKGDFGFIERTVVEQHCGYTLLEPALFNKIKNTLPKEVRESQEKLQKDALEAKQPEPAPEVKQAALDDVLGAENLESLIDAKPKHRNLLLLPSENVEVGKLYKRESTMVWYVNVNHNGNSTTRSLRTKDKKEATKIHNILVKNYNVQIVAKPESKPELIKTMTTIEQKPSILGGVREFIFGPKKQADETLTEEPTKEELYHVRDSNDLLVVATGGVAKGEIVKIRATIEEKQIMQRAMDALGATLVPQHIEEKKARLADLDQERKKLKMEIGNERT